MPCPGVEGLSTGGDKKHKYHLPISQSILPWRPSSCPYNTKCPTEPAYSGTRNKIITKRHGLPLPHCSSSESETLFSRRLTVLAHTFRRHSLPLTHTTPQAWRIAVGRAMPNVGGVLLEFNCNRKTHPANTVRAAAGFSRASSDLPPFASFSPPFAASDSTKNARVSRAPVVCEPLAPDEAKTTTTL